MADLGGVAVRSAPQASGEALHVAVTGVVQGVGFRPFVHRLAIRHGLAGWIRNRAGDVEIAVEGTKQALEEFLESLEREAPPLARIASVDVTRSTPGRLADFVILPSTDAPDRRQPVAPDVALCGACREELLDRSNSRYRYPFITCTDCGPRYTVIEAMPYDRVRTTMRAFTQCAHCCSEYASPGDRRYHSETNSCPHCGPRVWFVEGPLAVDRAQRTADALPDRGEAAIVDAARCLTSGGILALRGLGGFHLAADATDENAVVELRRRKRREAKPLAVMVRTLEEARALAKINDEEAALLTSPERPIVILEARVDSPLARAVSGLNTVGLVLAYTPLHDLLLEQAGRPLIMTSGNASEEPIAIGNAEALERLGEIADAFLLHDREIVARYDDSVVRVAANKPVMMRRARGYAPLPVPLPIEAPMPLIAVGPHLKNTFTLVHGRAAYVSQHIGDLDSLETLEHFRATLETYRRLFRIDPSVVVRDHHPGYLSSRIAEELELRWMLDVQHHHAHIAAVAAEHGVTTPVLGLAFDGTGLGEDGNVWGAEFLLADLCAHHRLAHLRYAPLPGGDLAARRPWRAALGYLSLEPGEAPAFAAAFAGVDPLERLAAMQQIERRWNSPLASSMGRLFDAAAAVLGLRTTSQYEGHAAMELESVAGCHMALPLPFPLAVKDDVVILDPLPLLVALGEQRAAGVTIPQLAAAFHESVAAAAANVVCVLRERTGVDTVALGGGVFQNARLLASVRARLADAGFRVLVPQRLPPNDGAISYGQAAIAASLLRARDSGEGGS
jgi:hydrogenase maturation protein HypF